MTDKRFDTTPKKKETVVKEHKRGKSIVVSHLRRFKLKDEKGREYNATRVDKVPKFSIHRGRTWDTFSNRIDGQPVAMRLDTTWGGHYFFEYQGKWWKMALQDVVQLKGHYFKVQETKK
jgi:hypothetical protein